MQAGGATAATAFLLLHPWAAAAARAAGGSSGAPNYLVRSSYVDLANPVFALERTTLHLDEVGDVAAARGVPSLRDSEDAFSLIFSGPGVGELATGTHQVRHSEIGTFDLYVGQVGQPGAAERIEVVVNRLLTDKQSIRAAQADERAAATAAPAAQEPGRAHATGNAADAALPHPKRPFRSVEAKRTKRGIKVVAHLAPSADVEDVTVWVRRGERVVASATAKAHGHRVALSVKPARRLRKGAYLLDLMATDAVGEQSHARKRVKLR